MVLVWARTPYRLAWIRAGRAAIIKRVNRTETTLTYCRYHSFNLIYNII